MKGEVVKAWLSAWLIYTKKSIFIGPFYNNLQIDKFNGQFQNCNMEKFRQLYVA